MTSATRIFWLNLIVLALAVRGQVVAQELLDVGDEASAVQSFFPDVTHPDEPYLESTDRPEPSPSSEGPELVGPIPPVFGSDQWRDHPGRWYSQQEIMFMNRGRPREVRLTGRLLGTNGVFPVFSEFLTSQSARLRNAPGTRLTLGTHLGRDDYNRDRDLEFTFDGLYKWEASNQLNSLQGNSGELFSPLDTTVAGFNFVDTHQMHYEADFNSFEINLRLRNRLARDRIVMGPDGVWVREATPGLVPSYLIGIRHVRADESFLWTSFATDADTRNGTYHVAAENSLVGMQVGLDLIYQDNWWTAGARGKFGGYVNYSQQETMVRIVDTRPAPGDRDELATAETMAVIGELQLLSTFRLRSNITLRTAFNLAWVHGLVIAPEQVTFDVSDPPRINTTGYTVNTGLSVGFDMVW